MVSPHPVTLGRSLGELRIIRDGLSATDRVVINGLQRVRPGITVAPVEGSIAEPVDGMAAAAKP